jgi:hypothetical protein
MPRATSNNSTRTPELLTPPPIAAGEKKPASPTREPEADFQHFKSSVREILLASQMFPRLYADVPNALPRGAIELKRAELILRALNTAVGNIKRVKFDLHAHEMVREIPNYPAPPTEEVDEAAEAAAEPTALSPPAPLQRISPNVGPSSRNSLRTQARSMETPQT